MASDRTPRRFSSISEACFEGFRIQTQADLVKLHLSLTCTRESVNLATTQLRSQRAVVGRPHGSWAWRCRAHGLPVRGSEAVPCTAERYCRDIGSAWARVTSSSHSRGSHSNGNVPVTLRKEEIFDFGAQCLPNREQLDSKEIKGIILDDTNQIRGELPLDPGAPDLYSSALPMTQQGPLCFSTTGTTTCSPKL